MLKSRRHQSLWNATKLLWSKPFSQTSKRWKRSMCDWRQKYMMKRLFLIQLANSFQIDLGSSCLLLIQWLAVINTNIWCRVLPTITMAPSNLLTSTWVKINTSILLSNNMVHLVSSICRRITTHTTWAHIKQLVNKSLRSLSMRVTKISQRVKFHKELRPDLG